MRRLFLFLLGFITFLWLIFLSFRWLYMSMLYTEVMSMYMYWVYLVILIVILVAFWVAILRDSIKILFLSFVLLILFDFVFIRSDVYDYYWKVCVCNDIGVCAERVTFGDGGYTKEKCLLSKGFWYEEDKVCSYDANRTPDNYTQKVKDVLFKNYYNKKKEKRL